jgi:hypothetical protein
MSDDFTVAAISNRILNAGAVYARAGDERGMQAVSSAMDQLSRAGSPEEARQIELDFNRGLTPFERQVFEAIDGDANPDTFDLNDPKVQLPDMTADGGSEVDLGASEEPDGDTSGFDAPDAGDFDGGGDDSGGRDDGGADTGGDGGGEGADAGGEGDR